MGDAIAVIGNNGEGASGVGHRFGCLVWVNPTASAGSVREAVTVHPLSQGNVGVEGQGKGSTAGNFIEVRAAGSVGKEANRNLPRDGVDGQGVDSGAAVSGDGESDHWRGRLVRVNCSRSAGSGQQALTNPSRRRKHLSPCCLALRFHLDVGTVDQYCQP